MSAPDPMDRDVKVMFTDHSTRDYIITASNLKEAEEVFDTIFNHMIFLNNIALVKKQKCG